MNYFEWHYTELKCKLMSLNFICPAAIWIASDILYTDIHTVSMLERTNPHIF